MYKFIHIVPWLIIQLIIFGQENTIISCNQYITIQDEKPINIPEEILKSYFSEEDIARYKESGTKILSITVYGEKEISQVWLTNDNQIELRSSTNKPYLLNFVFTSQEIFQLILKIFLLLKKW